MKDEDKLFYIEKFLESEESIAKNKYDDETNDLRNGGRICVALDRLLTVMDIREEISKILKS